MRPFKLLWNLALVGVMIVMLGVYLLALKFIDWRMRRKLKKRTKKIEPVSLQVPACDYPDLPEFTVVGNVEVVLPKGTQKRSDLITKLLGNRFDLYGKMTRRYDVDELTGMGFYEFKQE